uniref:Putative synaptophysin-like protein n=1 Tax=Xenopsylla cheopis TaxID=163159 RepID=A0A6M2DZ27_XENCH
MRIIQFIFSICAFATISGYSSAYKYICDNKQYNETIEYPFRIDLPTGQENSSGDLSSDAQFFVATGVLSFLYCIFVVLLYVVCDELYKQNTQIPLLDFGLTVVLAVFWLSGSAAWANGLNGLKLITNLEDKCTITAPLNFSTLNISVILGFLNFFSMGFRSVVLIQRDNVVPNQTIYFWTNNTYSLEI